MSGDLDLEEPVPYDDEEEIQLMDMDGTNLQLEEQVNETNNQNDVEKKPEISPLRIIEVCLFVFFEEEKKKRLSI